MNRERGGLAILGILTAALGATSFLGWLSGWPIVGVGTALGAACGGAMLARALKQRGQMRDDDEE